MGNNILHELVTILQTSCDRKPGIIPCMRYILGEGLGEQMSESNINKLYKGISHRLSPASAQLLLFSENWNSERFRTNCSKSNLDLNAFRTKLCALYYKFGFPEICSKEVNLMVKPLLLLHFFDIPDQYLIFFPFNGKNCGYYSVPDQYKDAARCLEQNNILFICGAPGTGKSELAKYIALFNSSFRNIGWVEATDSTVTFNTQLEEIPFAYTHTNGFHSSKSRTYDILNLLKQEPKTALLIIDLPFISKEDFEIIEKELDGLDIRIIFTTLTTHVPNGFSKISLDNQPISLLRDLFDNIVKKEYFTNNEFELFAENISHNPLIVTLAAKTIKRSPTDPTKSVWLDSDRWIMYESGLETVHTAYKDQFKNKSSYNIISLMNRLLFCYPHSFLENTANKLSIWCRQSIDKVFLSNYFSEDEINKAITYGILEYTTPDAKYLKMSNLLCYAIWANCPVQYDDYYDKICEFIDSFNFGKKRNLSYKTLYALIENMVFRFHYQVTFLPSRTNVDQRNRIMHWNSQLILIIKHLIRMGNYKLSRKIYSLLYKYETKKEKDLIIASEKVMSYISLLGISPSIATDETAHNIFDAIISPLNNFITQISLSDSSPKESELEQLYDFIQ